VITRELLYSGRLHWLPSQKTIVFIHLKTFDVISTILSRFGGVSDLQTGFGLDDWIYWHSSELHAITALSLFPHFALQCYIHEGPQFSLGVSWHRIHNSLTVTSNHTWSRLCTASFLSCHYSANSGTQLNSNSSCVRSSLYSLGSLPQKTPLPLLLRVDALLQRCLPRRCVATRAVRTAENTALPLLGAFASKGISLRSRYLARK
jgi:hypothetical protein